MMARDIEDPVDLLVQLLRKLPGVGERTARTRCRNISRSEFCPVCSDEKRDRASLCIVGSVQDLLAIERSGAFRGRYYVLGGYIAPLDGHGPEDIDTGRIVRMVAEEGVDEVILATNPTVEGDATANFLAGALKDAGARITRIATGIQHGGEIEYADPVSVSRALGGRRQF